MTTILGLGFYLFNVLSSGGGGSSGNSDRDCHSCSSGNGNSKNSGTETMTEREVRKKRREIHLFELGKPRVETVVL